jgi:hypothetical protein
MVRHIGWLCGFVVVLLLSWVLRASIPTPGSMPWARHLTGVPWSSLWTSPWALADSRVIRPPLIRVGPATSTNWSGYVVTGPTVSISDVTGSWVVPPVSCAAGETSAASFWIGIDGYSSPTVEQIGTDSDCQNGVPTYFAWIELFPLPSLIIRSVPVVPGDVISAEVKYDASSVLFEVAIANVTRGGPLRSPRGSPASEPPLNGSAKHRQLSGRGSSLWPTLAPSTMAWTSPASTGPVRPP